MAGVPLEHTKPEPGVAAETARAAGESGEGWGRGRGEKDGERE